MRISDWSSDVCSSDLISDVVMPNMDGPSMVARARATHPDLPVLFMSGYAEEQLRKSIDIANVAFLPKPFSVSQLAEAARDALALRPARSEGRRVGKECGSTVQFRWPSYH